MYRIVTLAAGCILFALPTLAQSRIPAPTLEGEGTLFERVAAIELESSEDGVRRGIIDPDGTTAYFCTWTSPIQIVKINLTTFERDDVLELNEGENNCGSAIIDPDGRYAYFGTFTSPGRVVKVDLETFERVDAIELAAGENSLMRALMDPDGAFAYFAARTSPSQVVKIDLETFERVAAIEFEEGENLVLAAAIDPAGAFAYFGTSTSPAGRVVKVDLETFERVGAIEFEEGERSLLSAVIDPDGDFAYFGTFTIPGQVVKVDLATFERVDAIELPEGENSLFEVVVDPVGAFAYFGTFSIPGRVVKIDLDTFQRVDSVVLSSGENYIHAAVIDPVGVFAYFGTDTSPGRVIKVQLREPPVGPPENDAIADATEIPTDNDTHEGSNVNATLEDGEPEPSCTFQDWTTNFSVWWSFTPDDNGLATIDTNGSLTPEEDGLDTILSLHNASDLSEVACDDDGGEELWSLIEEAPVIEGETYLIRVAGYNESSVNQGTIQLTTDFQFGIADDALPEAFVEGLSLPSPNPVNGTATLTLAVENGQHVTVEVFDATGRHVQMIYEGTLATGKSESLTLDASTLPAGVYVVRATGESFVKTRRVTVVK